MTPPTPPLTPATPAGDSPTPVASSDTNGPAPDPVAQQSTQSLLDISLSGTNVVFVLDRSASMTSDDKTLAARLELLKALHNLTTNQNFYIVASPDREMPAPTFMPATQTNIDAITNWVFSTGNVTNGIGSNAPAQYELKQAMQKAFKVKPDTVCLLSDGQFSTNDLEVINRSNDLVHASMNTVNFFSRQGEAILKQLAEDNNGIYRFVPPPGTNTIPGEPTAVKPAVTTP